MRRIPSLKVGTTSRRKTVRAVYCGCNIRSRYSPFTIIDPTYFPGRAAVVYYRPPPPSQKHSGLTAVKEGIKSALSSHSDIELGSVGILHPSVLEKFEIPYPCSALEITLEPFRRGTHS